MHPEIRVFAGPNGSGKSTFTTEEWIIPPYINADDIKRELNISDIDAAKLAEKMRNDAVDANRSFTFETVMSTDRNLLLLERAKAQGYFIKGYYILTRNPAINIARIQTRVSEGGHDVPLEKVVSRYWKSTQLIPRLYAVCDILHIYDNSANNGPVRLVRKHKFDVSIFPSAGWPETRIRKLIGVK